ncbi:hypothetical protein ACFO1B_34525 [Dactylosporangium siamense]|uniref:Uncharacterized protein n=1 Tax=Dactylosporangium siamense TaxID=685454 RepID=A0A919PJC0_9ACTN|nr:hypothetical protein [Dactylosporangium siamense]GIG44764.1 hypothetical protein Dsi01nite_028050 [Dactylosporangium siamense]
MTQRCRDMGRPQARERLDALIAALTAHRLTPVEVEEEYVLVEVEEEYVLVDDNPELDAGWIR